MIENLSTAEILRWYLDAGVDETTSDAPQNRFNEVAPKEASAAQKSPAKTAPAPAQQGPAVAETLLHDACKIAAAASSIEELNKALLDYDGCALKKTATNLVFGDGNPKAKIVLIGEGPGAQEDRQGVPFVERLMELIDPEVLITLGGPAAKSMLAETAGVGRLRGKWYTYATPKLSRPVQATALFHPEYLLNSPAHKREAWQDLLTIRDKLESLELG